MPRDPSEPSIVSAVGFTSETDSSASMVREDKRFITEKYGPMVLSSGEVFNIINTKEKGELVYVKIVTDNPYAAVLLELDDYRNQEPNGETVAELVYNGRTEKADSQFFAIDGDPAKGYALVYNPMSPEPYDYKIRIQVLNLIPRSSDVFGNNLRSTGRGGLPTPARPIHMAGGSFTYPGLAGASLETLAKAMAKPVGAQSYAAPNVYNSAAFDQDNLAIGAHTPYQGLAARPVFKRDTNALSSEAKGSVTIDGETIMTAEANPTGAAPTGVKVLFGSQHSSGVDPSNFPGSPTTPSNMSICIMDRTETAADDIDEGSMAVGDRVFIRNGDTIHFPGVVTALANQGVGGSNNKMTVEPGLSELPSKFEVVLDSETQTFGKVVTEADFSPKILVKQIIVKRRKLVSYEG